MKIKTEIRGSVKGRFKYEKLEFLSYTLEMCRIEIEGLMLFRKPKSSEQAVCSSEKNEKIICKKIHQK